MVTYIPVERGRSRNIPHFQRYCTLCENQYIICRWWISCFGRKTSHTHTHTHTVKQYIYICIVFWFGLLLCLALLFFRSVILKWANAFCNVWSTTDSDVTFTKHLHPSIHPLWTSNPILFLLSRLIYCLSLFLSFLPYQLNPACCWIL